ncbi:SigE family RNA polymerase sigma factor [Peterkaempfera griseoplana]|uniref:SigE family RNA polymerase sigma factor n=1 Tax=Peterkaempfera griseoplana TaxID=66896 RepID=UPI0006E1C2ED|nr:SigE family RNA polymerase sigma factor [Peterkaempfera griseoplana]
MASSRWLEEFQEFAHSSTPGLLRTALLLCGDWHLSEDLVQTALGKVYASWGRVRRADSPDAYARTVLTRTYISHARLRRSGERPVASIPDAGSTQQDPTLRLALLDALAQLSARDRAVVVLRYWLDRSVEQTAADLRVTPGAVRTRSMRALAKLRELLGSDRHALYAAH